MDNKNFKISNKDIIGTFDFIKYVAIRTKEDRLLRVAASLSYTSLIAIVPLFAIAIVMFSAFPVFGDARRELQSFIFDNFLLPESGKVVQDYLLHFVGATGKLTTVGVAGLAVTAILMLSTIETAFNAIFRVTRPRPFVARVLVYWTSLTLGPMLLGASFSLSGYLFAIREWFGNDNFAAADGFITEMMPSFLLGLAFMLLYTTIPYRSVKIKNAVIGGVVAAIMFGLLRSAFGLFAANVTSYKTLYGAMAVLPLFLIWMYLSWAVVLAGAVITASLPEWKNEILKDGENICSIDMITVALKVLSIMKKNALKGEGASRSRLIDEVGYPEYVFMAVFRKLRDSNFVDRTENKKWVLIKCIDDISLYEILEILNAGVFSNAVKEYEKKIPEVLKKRLIDSSDAQSKALDIKIVDIIDEFDS